MGRQQPGTRGFLPDDYPRIGRLLKGAREILTCRGELPRNIALRDEQLHQLPAGALCSVPPLERSADLPGPSCLMRS